MIYAGSPIQKVLLVGCGNMGRAMLTGWLANGISPVNVQVIDRHSDALDQIRPFQRPRLLNSISDIDISGGPACVVLAVKPQASIDVVRQLSGLADGSVVLSVAAGVTISSLTQALPTGVSVVRAMPNLPATIGQGVTVAVGSKDLSGTQHDICDRLLSATGKALWMADEAGMDAVTALSGNGPAYVFLLIEVLTKVGTELGLTPELAAELARSTILGSAALVAQSPETATALRQQVTSPHGTTEAALNVLMGSDALLDLFREALTAGRDRSIELSRQS